MFFAIGVIAFCVGVFIGASLVFEAPGFRAFQESERRRKIADRLAVERAHDNPEAMPRRHLERYPEPRSGVHGRWL